MLLTLRCTVFRSQVTLHRLCRVWSLQSKGTPSAASHSGLCLCELSTKRCLAFNWLRTLLAAGIRCECCWHLFLIGRKDKLIIAGALTTILCKHRKGLASRVHNDVLNSFRVYGVTLPLAVWCTRRRFTHSLTHNQSKWFIEHAPSRKDAAAASFTQNGTWQREYYSFSF